MDALYERRRQLGLDQPLVTTGPGGDYQRHIYPHDVDLMPRSAALVGAVFLAVIGLGIGVMLGAWIF